MKVLVIGGGGREHALAWKAAQSPLVSQVFVAPGNAGTALETNLHNVDIAADDVPALLAFATEQHIQLTIVGPEAPLAKGVVDVFREKGMAIFGPTQAAAQLESSKAFAKDFLARHHIPTAAYQNFTEVAPAKAFVKQLGMPIVIKADGLAAGKGVIIAQTEAEAFAAIDDMLSGNKFGDAGSRVVVEEFLHGEEASFIVMVDGEHALAFASSQDHKARDNGDKGPNTGGMGAYSPAPVVTPAVHDWVMQQVIYPTVRGMAAEGNVFTGFLYAGLMIAPDGSAKVLEFNCRFGDPETQPIMLRLESDLVALCQAAVTGKLDQISIRFTEQAAVGVVLAAGGYPDSYAKGIEIKGLDGIDTSNAKVFHAGTALVDDKVLTNGGRVLCATALGANVSDAQQAAYELASHISWDGMFYRSDIGYRAVAREQKK
ncbi:phosphoribosylamine--glycine ligase [Arsukibacterium sp. UBA3155]|uniref:phosphoribosylamine--glycine ligase n=1 Tax=Arsukibacterium sp. UBA3155 TaxID=1946058 RepID=UPI0025C6B78D|nr:phosphoribosylamine--glycine ligase [Arsukibacterium sp. UBA3155]|tara:strand:- start:70378 stop:71667 length:1290 start_codon:yes stop_codon:yes gene_type:complete